MCQSVEITELPDIWDTKRVSWNPTHDMFSLITNNPHRKLLYAITADAGFDLSWFTWKLLRKFIKMKIIIIIVVMSGFFLFCLAFW